MTSNKAIDRALATGQSGLGLEPPPFDERPSMHHTWASLRVLLRCFESGTIERRPRFGSDRHGQLVERDRQPLVRWRLDRQLVVSATDVLDEGIP
jgi:hypothetical protein